MATNTEPKPLSARELGDLCRSLTRTAIAELENILLNPDANVSAKIKAAEVILDRGYGKAQQVVEVNKPTDPQAVEKLIDMLLARAPELIKSKMRERGMGIDLQ